uniref:Protein P7 n=1 Tax=Rice gall dwarf virus TaxID=10986 RepID=D6PAI3_RGDV|nr:putative nucleic acid binding protein [Rice gall dwarf virus]
MTAFVCVSLLSEKAVLVKNLTDHVKAFYESIIGRFVSGPDTITEKRTMDSVIARKIVPSSTVILDGYGESFIRENPNATLMDIVTSSNNTAPKTTYQSIMPSMSALLGVPYVQGAFRHGIISKHGGKKTSLIILVVAPPSGFIRAASVGSSSSVVEVDSNATIKLDDTVGINSAMIKNTKLVSAAGLTAMGIEEIPIKCNSLDPLIIGWSMKYFKGYVDGYKSGVRDQATTILLNTPFKDLFVENGAGRMLPNDSFRVSESTIRNQVIEMGEGTKPDALISTHGDVFIDSESVFTSDEQEKYRKDKDEEFFKKCVCNHIIAGDYGNNVVIIENPPHSDVRGLGIKYSFQVNKPELDGTESNGIKYYSRDTPQQIHDAILDVISDTNKSLLMNSKPIERTGKEAIAVCFKNGFPKKFAMVEMEKNGVKIVGMGDSPMLVLDNYPSMLSRAEKANRKSSRAKIDAPVVKIDTEDLDTNTLLDVIKKEVGSR